MSETDTINPGATVKYTGVFDLSLLYKRLNGWILREKWKGVKEKRYVERIKPFGKIMDIEWQCPRPELDGYLEINLSVKFLLIGINEVEIDRPSGKIKLHKGDLEIQFATSFVRNAKNEWSDKSLAKKIYEKFLIGPQIENYKIEAYKNTEKIIDETKNFIALYRF